MKELDLCLKLRREINEIHEHISELRSKMESARNQVISDMPKSKSVNSGIESYIIKCERLEEKRDKKYKELDETWDRIRQSFILCGVKEIEERAMFYRFVLGFKWNTVAAKMSEDHQDQNWNANKCFRTYRSVLYKLRKYNF